ncbi:formylglycine-generating enzyme family protein [methane-oxidizing endosymbiont of Gigantopelta aegis]|uniref:formylglycine-generating enzyme family protein n=1 Tax=methane-oxidizing endosymbiont of Gigantopelta aegis TaxID=2794938 RepID=UPI0018DEC52B|nr:SUMF1/EgtB/PvdO family nonheme iron enzyme [methane-oxidizing endosymbiont of Gigantopelta aegis]
MIAFVFGLILFVSLTPSSLNAKSLDILLKPKLQRIPAGCFQMRIASLEQEQKLRSGQRICFRRYFEMGVHEVTIAEFKRFVAQTNYISDAEIDYLKPGCWSYDENKQQWGWWSWANWRQPVQGEIDDRQPVSCVNYYDIQAYITWLNAETGEHYRLPTEAEWEYAARAGRNNDYFWGNNPDLACRYSNIFDLNNALFFNAKGIVSYHCDDGFVYAAPVKTFLPNPYQLYDMIGNVWEWTCSEFKPDYAGQEQRCVNLKDNPEFIAVRGGGWNAEPERSRLDYRNWQSPWVRLSTWGFRLVKVQKKTLRRAFISGK